MQPVLVPVGERTVNKQITEEQIILAVVIEQSSILRFSLPADSVSLFFLKKKRALALRLTR